MVMIVMHHSMALWLPGGWFNQPPQNESVLLGYLAGMVRNANYVFVFISGYIFSYQYNETTFKTYKQRLKAKTKRLILPYLAVSVIWVIPFQIYFFGSGLKDLLYLFALGVAPRQLWFLIMLFVVWNIFYFFVRIIERLNISVYICIFLMMCLYYGGIFMSRFVDNYFQIWSATNYILFYYLGYLVRKGMFKKVFKVHWIIYLGVCVLVYSVYYFFTSYCNGLLLSVINYSLLLLIAVTFTLFLVCVISQNSNKNIQNNKIYKIFEKYNFQIYLFHQQFIYVTVTFLNGKIGNFSLVMCNFIFSIVGALIICILVERVPLGKKIIGIK